MSTGTATAFSLEELQRKLAQLEKDNARLTAEKAEKLSVRIGPKGGLVIRGVGRWPITLYVDTYPKVKAFFNSGVIEQLIEKAEPLGFLSHKDGEYELPDKYTLTPEEIGMFTNSAFDPPFTTAFDPTKEDNK